MWSLALAAIAAAQPMPAPSVQAEDADTHNVVFVLPLPAPEADLKDRFLNKLSRKVRSFDSGADYGSAFCVRFTEPVDADTLARLANRAKMPLEQTRVVETCNEPPREMFRPPPTVASWLVKLETSRSVQELRVIGSDLLQYRLPIAAVNVPDAGGAHLCVEFFEPPVRSTVDFVFQGMKLDVVTVQDADCKTVFQSDPVE